MGETLIHDIEKARAMAVAGKGSPYRENNARDGAAKLRAEIKKAKLFVDNEDRYDEWEVWYSQNYEEGGYENEPYYLVDLDGEEIKRPPRPKQFIVKAVEKAIEYDRHAEQLEYWASILYDHPVSYEYLRKFNEPWENGTLHWRLKDAIECGLDPEWLVILEDALANDKKAAGEWRDRANDFNSGKIIPRDDTPERSTYTSFYSGHGLTTRLDLLKAIEDITERHTYQVEDDLKCGPELREYDELLSDDKTTIRDLVEFYKRLCRSRVTRLNEEAEQIESFLKDVQSGRAVGKSFDQMIDDGEIDWSGKLRP